MSFGTRTRPEVLRSKLWVGVSSRRRRLPWRTLGVLATVGHGGAPKTGGQLQSGGRANGHDSQRPGEGRPVAPVAFSGWLGRHEVSPDEIRMEGNRWAIDLIRSQRETSRWNLLAGGIVLTAAGSVMQFADADVPRIIGAVGLVLALGAFGGVVWFWHRVTSPRDPRRESAPYMSGIERELVNPLRKQGYFLALEFGLLALTLAATLVGTVISDLNESEGSEASKPLSVRWGGEQ